MKITLLAAGSRGDTQPYVALGVALVRAGHQVLLAASTPFRELVESYGLAFHPVAGDPTALTSDPRIQAAMRADTPLKFIRSFRQLSRLADVMQPGLYDACRDADAVVYHPGATVGYFAARERGVPSVLASPFPMTPTRAYPALIAYGAPRLGGWSNLLGHRLFERTMWFASRGPVERFWKEAFGASPAEFGSPFLRQRSRTHPTIVSLSGHVFPRPHDWPEHVHLTGYWFLDEPPGWRPAPELTEFLDRGPPPVYVGFGSLGDPDSARRTTELVAEALRRAGRRGVLATGWGGLSSDAARHDGLLVIEGAPHSWLFARMAAVVHHGGAGTTAAALRAGVPSVVVPHSNDQFAWGRRVHELGVGAAPIPRKKLTAERLEQALEQADDEAVRDAADALGRAIRAEDGVGAAVRVIEACVAESE